MKTKTRKTNKGGKREPRRTATVRAKASPAAAVHRQSPPAVSSGLEFDDALLVEVVGRKRKERLTTTETRSEEEARISRLARHPFCRGMNHAQTAMLADCAITSHFKAGEILFREGKPAERLYLIESGKVVLESSSDYGDPVVIETIGAGDLLGWSWMMLPYVWHFTARAVEPTEAIHFAGPILRQYCERDHSLGFELHKPMSAVMMKRLQAARKKMLFGSRARRKAGAGGRGAAVPGAGIRRPRLTPKSLPAFDPTARRRRPTRQRW